MVDVIKETRKDGLVVLAGVIIGMTSAAQILKLFQLFSIGRLLQAAVFVIPLMMLLPFVVSGNPVPAFSSTKRIKHDIRPSWIAVLVFSGAGVAPLLLWLGSNVSLTYFLIGSLILAAFFVSVLWCGSGKTAEAVALMLLTFPFVKFIEYNFQGTSIERIAVGPIVITPRVLWLFSLFLASLARLKKDEPAARLQKYPKALFFLFFVVSVISSLASQEPILSLRGIFLEIACPYVFFYLVLKSIADIEDIHVLILGVIGYLTILLAQGIYFFYQQYGFIFGEAYLYQQNFGLFNIYRVSTSALIGIYLLLIFWNKAPARFKPAILATVFFLCAFVILSQTRVAVLACAVSLLFYALSGGISKDNIKKMTIIIAGLICIVLVFGFHFDRIFNLVSGGNFFLDDDRSTAWSGSLKMIRDYPLFGIGWHMWPRYVASYIPAVSRFSIPYAHVDYILNPHNLYLSLAVFFGLPALSAFFFIVLYLVRHGILIMIRHRGNAYGETARLALAALVCYLSAATGGEEHFFTADNVASGMFLDFSKGFLFFLLAAIILRIENIATS